MKHCLIFCLSCFSLLSATAQESVTIEAIQEKVTIDGLLQESIWQKAVPISLNYETHPGNNLEATTETILRLAYDQEQLYFAFEVFDPDPTAIRAILNDRDRLDDNDRVSLFLDPFNDSRRAFFFTLNPFGIQQDGFFDQQTGNEDLSWDGIWNSNGRITERGYVVEGAIPFKSLRFPNTTDIQTWRFFARRVYPRSVFKVFHNMSVDQDNACVLCQARTFTGLQGITPGRNLEFTPTYTLNKIDQRPDFPEKEWSRGGWEHNVGLDARWGITTDLSFNGTFNPDFSNVEADAAQIDINNRFALRFPEKRPFFVEGADFFNTPLQAFFTRSIVAPTFGAKLTGKVGRNAVGLLVADDRSNQLILPGFQSSSSFIAEEKVTNVIGRYRRDIGENVNIGGLFTHRTSANYLNRVGGVDGFIRPWQPLTFRWQYMSSDTRYDDRIVDENNLSDDTPSGNSYNLTSRFDTRNWNAQYTFEYRDPGFRADAGFVPQVDFVHHRFWVERVFWPDNKGPIVNFGGNTGGFRRTSTDGLLESGGMWVSGFINGPLQTNFWVNPDVIWQQFQGSNYTLRRLWFGFDTQPLGNLGINGWINLGPAVDFANNRKADNTQFRIESDIRIGTHIDMTINHRFVQLRQQETGLTIFTANLTQLQGAYNFNPRLFFKFILQYRHTVRNPDLYETSVHTVDKSVFAQLLLSYKVNPQSVVFLGYIDNHTGLNDEFEERQIALTQVNQTLFFKIGYAWRP
ncbi:MAG: DUF5916 domain-containing protein [Cytophagales bacterium]|nr:DUF5916 domain-containing protein [Cytophagales bacterium]